MLEVLEYELAGLQSERLRAQTPNSIKYKGKKLIRFVPLWNSVLNPYVFNSLSSIDL